MRPTLWSIGLAGATLLAVLACRDRPATQSRQDAAADAEVPAEIDSDAQLLSRELFDIVDRTMSYASSHQNRLPSSLHTLGIDSLTAITARSLTLSGKTPLVTVVFRRPGGRSVTSCRATDEILEESMMRGGQFTVTCTLPTGEGRPFRVIRRGGRL